MSKFNPLTVAAAIVAAVSALPMAAHAELPAGVATAITASSTDGLSAVGLLAAAGAAVFLIYKVLKRLGIL